MGTCIYYTNPNGNAVATWVGSGTDLGKTKRVIFLKGSRGASSKTAACDNARAQFCKQYGINGRCYDPGIKSQVKCVQREGDKIGYALQGLPIPPSCADLTYKADPLKGTGAKQLGSGGTTNGTSGDKGIKNEPGCKCGCEFTQGSWSRAINCLGYNMGNFFTDAARSGNEQLPMLLLVGVAVFGIFVLAR